MCDPTSLLIAQGGGSLMSAMGARSAASAQKTSLNAEAALEDTNAKIAEMNAQSAIVAGQREEQKSRIATSQLKGSQKVALAANGIQLDGDPTSTANNILTSTDTLGEIDANTTAANAIRSAWGYRIEETNHKNNALMKRATAKQTSPNSSFATSLLGSATSLGMNYYSLKKAGAFDAP